MSCHIRNHNTGYYIGIGALVPNGNAIILKKDIKKNDIYFIWDYNDGVAIFNKRYNEMLSSNGLPVFSFENADYSATFAAVHPLANNLTAFVKIEQPNKTYTLSNTNNGFLCVYYPNGNEEASAVYIRTFTGAPGNRIENITWNIEDLS